MVLGVFSVVISLLSTFNGILEEGTSGEGLSVSSKINYDVNTSLTICFQEKPLALNSNI